MKLFLICLMGVVAMATGTKPPVTKPPPTNPPAVTKPPPTDPATRPTRPPRRKYSDPKDLECCCAGCGDPSMVSYDGALKLLMNGPTKTTLSAWGGHSDEGMRDMCKFGIRVVTKDDIDGATVPLHYDWLGVGFGKKEVEGRNKRNGLMGQDLNGNVLFGVRGEGTTGVVMVDLEGGPYEETHDGCTWKFEKKNDNLLTMRSDCCPIAVNWRPNGVNTCWEIFVGGQFLDGNMAGMCADCNGNNEDDIRECPTGPVLPGPFPPFPFSEMEESCSNAEHTGLFFPGLRRVE